MKKRRWMEAAVATTLLGCGGGGTTALSSQGAYQALFWSYCLPVAEVMTSLAEDGDPTVASEPVDCPDGGTATYDPETGEVVLNNCSGAGATASGSITVSTLQVGQAAITSGSLEIIGDYEGAATINSGIMSWEVPVQDPSLYWELRIVLDGEQVCIWSGAEIGECPPAF